MTENVNLIKKAYDIPTTELFADTCRRINQRRNEFGGQPFAFRFARGPELSESDVVSAVDLIEAGTKHHAEHSSMGWSREQKVHQLTDPTSWVAAVEHAVSEPEPLASADADAPVDSVSGPRKVSIRAFAALLCFRFEPEEEEDFTSAPVLYCYELHVAAAYRRAGLGRFLARELAHIAKTTNMDRVMLTVLLENKDALAFYGALGFYTDETSPDDADYRILALNPA